MGPGGSKYAAVDRGMHPFTCQVFPERFGSREFHISEQIPSATAFPQAMDPPPSAPTRPSETSDPDALIALSVAQAVPLPTDIDVDRPTIQTGLSSTPRRVDYPVQEDQGAEEMEVERGPATMWLKENQLMLTYFVAGEHLRILNMPSAPLITPASRVLARRTRGCCK